MTPERAVMLVKKVTYLEQFGYLNSSCIRKVLFHCFEFLERKIHAFVAKLSDICFCLIPAAMLVPIWNGYSRYLLN